jgi:hypothetical protein
MSTLLSSRTFERVPAKTTAIITVRVRDAVQADNVIELTVRYLVLKLMRVAFIAFDGNNVSVVVKSRQKVSEYKRRNTRA